MDATTPVVRSPTVSVEAPSGPATSTRSKYAWALPSSSTNTALGPTCETTPSSLSPTRIAFARGTFALPALSKRSLKVSPVVPALASSLVMTRRGVAEMGLAAEDRRFLESCTCHVHVHDLSTGHGHQTSEKRFSPAAVQPE